MPRDELANTNVELKLARIGGSFHDLKASQRYYGYVFALFLSYPGGRLVQGHISVAWFWKVGLRSMSGKRRKG